VNAPLVSLPSKNTNNANSEVRFKQLMRDLQSVVRSQSTPALRINLNEHPIEINTFLVRFHQSILKTKLRNSPVNFMGL
jgi:hypothetical protein